MNPASTPARVVAACDPSLSARMARRVPLLYAEGPSPADDRPGHVRAGSGVARVGGHLVVVQDDAHFLAIVAPDGRAHALALPPGADGGRQFDDRRGNKHLKMDLEACFAAPDDDGRPLFVALGSGSSSRRERVVVARGLDAPQPSDGGAVVVREAGALYAALRGAAGFAPGEMNVEGACYVGGRVRLFGRGNGASRDGHASLDATCDLDWPALRAYLADPERAGAPVPSDVVQYALGEIGGLRLGFTDATAAGERRILFCAAAEDSPDATRDGRVSGSAVGLIDERGHARWTLVLDENGQPFAGKAEGLALVPGEPAQIQLVIDQDDPDAPSVLCDVTLGGEWG